MRPSGLFQSTLTSSLTAHCWAYSQLAGDQASREVSDPAHRTSPPDGGHVPCCLQAAAPLQGGGEVPLDWSSHATEKGKINCPEYSWERSVSKLLWGNAPIAWRVQTWQISQVKECRDVQKTSSYLDSLHSHSSQWNPGHVRAYLKAVI